MMKIIKSQVNFLNLYRDFVRHKTYQGGRPPITHNGRCNQLFHSLLLIQALMQTSHRATFFI